MRVKIILYFQNIKRYMRKSGMFSMALKHPNIHADHQKKCSLDTESYHEAKFVITGSCHKSSFRAASDKVSVMTTLGFSLSIRKFNRVVVSKFWHNYLTYILLLQEVACLALAPSLYQKQCYRVFSETLSAKQQMKENRQILGKITNGREIKWL